MSRVKKNLGGRPSVVAEARKMCVLALRHLRQTRKRDTPKIAQKRGVDRRKISLRVLQAALPKVFSLPTIAAASKGLLKVANPPKPRAGEFFFTQAKWDSYRMSQNSQGW